MRTMVMIRVLIRILHASLFMLACLLTLLPATTAAATPSIAVVTHGNNPAYAELIDALNRELSVDTTTSLNVINSASINPLQLKQALASAATPILTIGTRAAERVLMLNLGKPVIAALIPRQSFEQLVNKSSQDRKDIGAIYLDQPPQRIIRLIQQVLPGNKVLGLLAKSSALAQKDDILAAAKLLGMPTITEYIEQPGDLYRVLPKLLDAIDILYPLPDPDIYISGSVEFLFLTSYRKHVPIIGFSETSVRAGALAAIYTTPEQIGRQLALTLKQMKKTEAGGMPGAYPQFFNVRINQQVARSLGLSIASEATIKQRLQRDEARK